MPSQNPIFIPGPTNIPEAVRRALDVPMEDQRAPDFPDFTLPLFADLKRVFKTAEGEALIFPASGTGGWEAALTNLLSPGDKVLTSRFGQFSTLWADMCTRLGLEVVLADAPWGEGVPVEQVAKILEADKGHEIKAVLVCHNETATGVTSDVPGVRRALDDTAHPAMLFVDGVSSIASIDFRMDEWRVDCAVSGSQKGFMLPPGLALIAVSQRALDEAKNAKMPRCYFDFAAMLELNRSGFFPYTPATGLMRGLRAAMDLLLAEGLDNVFARHHRMAQGVRLAVDAWGLNLVAAGPQWQSDTVSAIRVPEGADATAVISGAFHKYGLSLGTGLAQLSGKVFRIGHLGSVTELMLISGLAGAEMAMRDAGIDIELGSGVAAAQTWYVEAGDSLALAAE